MKKHIIGENGIGYTLGADLKASFLVNSSGESMQASFPADELSGFRIAGGYAL